MSLMDEFQSAWKTGKSMDDLLSRLVIETQSRAAGCWRLDGPVLKLVGFGWAADMAPEVSGGFQDATRLVPLDQIGLGIVKAAVSDQPAIGRRDGSATGLDGSASWIEKFKANTSLAIPIHDRKANCVAGVLAVSTAAFVEPNDALWRLLHQLAAALE